MDPVTTYQMALRDLTFNSKPIINNLTILAGQNVTVAPAIVQVILSHMERVNASLVILLVPVGCQSSLFVSD